MKPPYECQNFHHPHICRLGMTLWDRNAFTLLVFCEENPSVDSHPKRPLTWSFIVSFVVNQKNVQKQSSCRWFETPWSSRHVNVIYVPVYGSHKATPISTSYRKDPLILWVDTQGKTWIYFTMLCMACIARSRDQNDNFEQIWGWFELTAVWKVSKLQDHVQITILSAAYVLYMKWNMHMIRSGFMWPIYGYINMFKLLL